MHMSIVNLPFSFWINDNPKMMFEYPEAIPYKHLNIIIKETSQEATQNDDEKGGYVIQNNNEEGKEIESCE